MDDSGEEVASINIETLIRAHRELALMMGYSDATRGVQTYTYQMFMDDLNTLHPHIVAGIDQMKKCMVGQAKVPFYWEKPLNELLELAVTGQRQPPRPGPFWHPTPLNKKERRLAAIRLVEWQAFSRSYNTTVAEASEVTPDRISRIRHGRTAILPTELDRIALAFGTDRAGFLRGPHNKGGGL